MSGQVTGRRGAVVDEAILAAAMEELSEKGYSGFRIDDLAARVGVHKTTVYRRWPDKATLLTDAVLQMAVEEFSIPDTGDIDADVRTAIRTRVAWLTGPYGRPLVRMLGSDASTLPPVRQAMARIMRTRQDVIGERLHAAAAAGQVPAGVDPTVFLGTLIAPVYLALLVLDVPCTEQDADRAAGVALVAARSGLLRADGVAGRGAGRS